MNLKSGIAELVGTFALVFLGAGAAAIGAGGLLGVALAHGITLMVFAYAFGSISGTHINPAVSLAMAVAGKIKWGEALQYWIFQFAGAAIAGYALLNILGGSESGLGATIPADGMSIGAALLVEALLTFFLVNTILNTTDSENAGVVAPIAIGGTLAAAILMGGPLTGASLNPARTFGPALFTANLDVFWLYIIGPAAGAVVAVYLNKWLKS